MMHCRSARRRRRWRIGTACPCSPSPTSKTCSRSSIPDRRLHSKPLLTAPPWLPTGRAMVREPRVAVCLNVAWLLALAAGGAHAQSFVCTTASGKTVVGDQFPPECFDRETRELRSDGSLRRIIPPPLTPEQ